MRNTNLIQKETSIVKSVIMATVFTFTRGAGDNLPRWVGRRF